MTYFKASGVERLTLPSDSDYWVEMKNKLSYGDRLAAQEAMIKVSASPNGLDSEEQQVVTELETGTYFTTLLCRSIVRWNIDDEDGRVLDVTEEAIARLDDEDGEFLLAQARKRLKTRPKAAELPFGQRSPQRSQDSRSPAHATRSKR